MKGEEETTSQAARLSTTMRQMTRPMLNKAWRISAIQIWRLAWPLEAAYSTCTRLAKSDQFDHQEASTGDRNSDGQNIDTAMHDGQEYASQIRTSAAITPSTRPGDDSDAGEMYWPICEGASAMVKRKRRLKFRHGREMRVWSCAAP